MRVRQLFPLCQSFEELSTKKYLYAQRIFWCIYVVTVEKPSENICGYPDRSEFNSRTLPVNS